jgi:hypothetical protein
MLQARAAEQLLEAKKFAREREPLLNPPQFQDLGSQIFRPRPVVQALLENIYTQEVTYRRVWPKHCSNDVIKMAKANGDRIHTDLTMLISFPKALKRATTPTKVFVGIEMVGGGGVSSSVP